MSLNGARATAMMAAAIGIGGSMTYGQTVGLSHDREIIGNIEAWRWGMLGLFLKGGVWIGFGGFFLGIGLGGKKYRPLEMTIMLTAAVGLYALGLWLINSPFDPGNKRLPFLYFSDHWQFEPERFEAGLIKPRWETFGGYWLGLIGLALYARVVRGDKLALRMAIVGVIAGGLGFSGGQCTQSAHAWHPEWFQEDGVLGFGASVFNRLNWWNVMETSFGVIWGAIMGFGLWFNRHLIDVSEDDDYVSLAAPAEIMLACMYVTFILVGDFGYLNPDRLPIDQPEFASTHTLEFISYWYVEVGIIIAAIPLIGIAGGRIWPYMMLLILIAIPICGKTLRAVGFNDDNMWHPGLAWFCLVQMPLAWGLVIAAWLSQQCHRHRTAMFAATTLIFTSVLYFSLNSVFWFAWPFGPDVAWSKMNPNQIFNLSAMVCLVAASIAVLLTNRNAAAHVGNETDS
jgi:hypothetical protein